MDIETESLTTERVDRYVKVNRQLRWLMIAAVAITGSQMALLAGFTLSGAYQPTKLAGLGATLISVVCLSGLGLLLDRLTRRTRLEHQTLSSLSKQMKIERERLLVLINTLPEAALVIDEQARVLFYNAGALALLNTHSDLHGKDLAQLLIMKNGEDRVVGLLDMIHGTTHARRTDLSLHIPSQPTMLIDCNIAAVRARAVPKSTINYVVICRDITKEKTVEQQREEFIAVASHELRTPLTIVEAALSSVLLPAPKGLDAPAANMVDKAYRNVLFLSELVTDLTILSEAQNDAIPIKLQPVDPATLLKQLASDYRHAVDGKGLKLDIVLPSTPLAPILTTEHHVHEILQNFLTNAIKYSSQGQITLEATSGTGGTVIFRVRDSGIGISPSDQQKLFSKFYRSEDYRTRQTGGTGLGLYLCAQLAKRLNGRVWCESTLDQGSTFCLEIPPLSQLKRDRAEVVVAGTAALVAEL